MTEATPSERLTQATALTIKAMGRAVNLEVGLSSQTAIAEVKAGRVILPAPDEKITPESRRILRGHADEAALRLRHHNPKLHAARRPEPTDQRMAFDALEQARIEALGAHEFTGVGQNLSAVMEKASAETLVLAKDALPFADALRLIAYEHFAKQTLPPHAASLAGIWREAIESKGDKRLATLGGLLHDQKAFAAEALRLLTSLDPSRQGKDDEDAASQAGSETEEDQEPDNKGEETTDEAAGDDADQDAGEESGESTDESQPMLSDEDDTVTVQSEGEDGDDLGDHWPQNERYEQNGPPTTYRAYTRQFDEIVGAEELATPEELTRLRTMLDRQMRGMQPLIMRLANRLQRRLMAKQTRSWDFDQEDGLLDTSRLARIVTSPSHSLAYKREKSSPFRDTVVSILLDNSGSMRGRPIALAAISADILARTLERCGVKTEILGFTTRAWKGGLTRDFWMKSGKPPFPGRLNDLRHVIYKSADEPWRRTRRNLGLMLREGLLKENIDGEALLWAHGRLSSRREQRRILMVISDGAPVDDATLSANPATYLEEHLRAVVHWIEGRRQIELLAVGIGHDVGRTYHRAVTINDTEQLASVMTEQLTELFAV